MKRIAAILLLLLVSVSTFSQIQNHAKWSFEVPKKEVKVGDVIEIKFNADIDPTWHLYSTEFEVKDGPNPTEFAFKPNDSYQLVGKIKPVGFHKFYEEVWGGNTSVAEGKGSFVQKVKILKVAPQIEVAISYQTCQNDGLCTMGNADFIINTLKVVAASNTETPTAEATAPTAEPQVTENVQPTTTPKADTTQAEATASAENTISDVPVSEPEESLWSFLLACFLGGLASIFMPCIYPIMPMTVSYFTKQEHGTGKALVYGLSIVAIFTLLGFLVSRVGGAQAANFISTHWAPNAIFFVVFILFGLSFLGLFEIVLPNSFVNSVDKQADKGGLIGIFFMALTLVVVSFSCTAPIAGSLLILASKGNEVMRPVLGMIFFSLPFAVVFTGLAMFPKFLKSLPKSGGWLNEFKVVFGLLEFALALKFLSNIDLAYQWQVLDREVFLAIWIVLFSIIGFYVLGKLRMDKDSPVKGITIPRLLISSATFAFVVYMIPGMFGAPLRALSGWLPPEQTQDFYLTNAVGGGTSAPALTASGRRKPHLPHGLEGYFDYEQALAEAKAQGKPVFIDFTGFNCANCRKMEANVWPQPEVLERLKKNFVIASLYVDDKTELPKEKQFVSTYDQREKTTIGDKNADLQITKFNNNAQPFYCLVTPEGELLTKPVGYTSAEEFTRFLDEGLTKYKK
ncbi:thioredoxin fold domain-containing protein [Runella sp. CRIBMP]|uniref:protein-disulfide reductase DsbD family protein n=1 Tax=Runella sp. CRIBMP TaxID=2683261 RepID=UPI0014126DDD|nr:thioredoxin family protein [Runella sp. CRIBMP]NBB20064.1 thioredoxin fold domain-containing protein [Runella sp. CRIBMP]